MTAPEIVEVPFAGLRRNSRALAFGFAILAVVLALPDLAPVPTSPSPVELVHGRVLALTPSPDDPSQSVVTVEAIDGPRAGERLEGQLQGPSGAGDVPDYQIGDEVVVSVSTDPEAPFTAISDRYRLPTLSLLLGLFAVAVTVVGGWRGVRALIALSLTLAVVVKIVVPLILGGWDPAWVAILTASGVTAVTFLLTEGARRTTLAAAVGTFASLTLVAALAIAFDALARFTALRGSEDAGYLVSLGIGTVDLGGLVLAAIIFGALGILDDVTVTQAATVGELAAADPGMGRWQLARRAMNVGRSHIAATVNTLVLAYVGASLPLIVLFAAGRQDPTLIVSGEVVAVEVVRALVGSIGIVAAVPITTAVAVGLLRREVPLASAAPIT